MTRDDGSGGEDDGDNGEGSGGQDIGSKGGGHDHGGGGVDSNSKVGSSSRITDINWQTKSSDEM